MTAHTKAIILDTLRDCIRDSKEGKCVEHRLGMLVDFIDWEKPENQLRLPERLYAERVTKAS